MNIYSYLCVTKVLKHMGMLFGIDWHCWLIGACRVWIKLVKQVQKNRC